MKNIGLYIHIPFCKQKCPYCDFYSVPPTEKAMDDYVSFLNKKISSYQGYNADTIYFGGGTPGLLGTERIISLLKTIKKHFGDLQKETTIELNPESSLNLDYEKLHYYGINRISVGLQSSNERELSLLGRTHSPYDAANVVKQAKEAGIDNISLDLMIGISGQTAESLLESIRFCSELNAAHISVYMLKIEKGTWYYKNQSSLMLPDEDTVCDYYEMTVKKLSECGYLQYEISNFAKSECESIHNLKYWNCEEYLGLGAAAHSFIDKNRFYYTRSIRDFYDDRIVHDGVGGDEEEYIAMKLRLTAGLEYDGFKAYFGYSLPEHYIVRAKKLNNTGLLCIDNVGIRLTVKGFLCSNAVIAEILY